MELGPKHPGLETKDTSYVWTSNRQMRFFQIPSQLQDDLVRSR